MHKRYLRCCRCIRPTPEELENFSTPDFTIYNAGQFPCNRYTHYMTSSTSVDLNLARKEMVILGTQYAGEMKKGLFSLMHYLMPKRQILSLHSGCNMGKDGDVALFFGLSGTGKTTLSTDHNRLLIGDDEHCWSDNGVSNIEGGCYAKCIDLSKEKEPDIWNAIKFGTGKIHNVAGTEEGVKEPQATFSACFGAAFIMLHPTRYAAMLAEKMQRYGATGYGVGSRIKLAYTRKIIDAIHSGSLLTANYKKTEVFGLDIPTEIEGVPSEILDPMNTDKAAYRETLLKLAGLFRKNFEVFVNYKIGKEGSLTEEILAAGPSF
ncbi:hypothetical protein BHE74_00004455 [Ensete ventricosum]|nr:hypothetical protein BHE74_00004455 [Ensete ventricosum]RZR79519.1 hypothetical protein BHM03_00005249 [Ensete ventricosum]